MKPNELAFNILQARQHIRRLKKQAQIINTQFKNTNNNHQEQQININQYVNNALYSLNKNDNQIQSKVQEFKNNKLPLINQKTDRITDGFYLKDYKKSRKQYTKKPLTKNKVNSFSTRADQSISFQIQNKKIKIHSFHQKNKPGQINSQTNLGTILQHDTLNVIESLNFEKQSSSHSAIRKRKIQQKVKLINFNQSSFMKDIPEQQSKRQSKEEGYQSLIDSFSNHFFMIINGKTAKQSPEFASYQRIYKSIFQKIQHKIQQLQKLLKLYDVKFAKFDGKKLAYLCLKQHIKKSQLIDCLIQGKQQLVSKIPQTKYKGKQGKIKAINKIKAFLKMLNVRKKYQKLKKKTIILQKFFRKNKLILDLQKNIIKRNQKMIENFQNRQNQFQKKFKQIKKQNRIQIHLNSIQTDEQKRLTIENYSERQNIQLSRIFQLKDQKLILIYVSTKQINQELINYYYKILELSNIPNYKDRLIFINPNIYNFPEHFSTTKLLYYCSKTLNQLKVITSGMTTILYGGNPCNQLIKICDFLNCYLFSGQPNKMKLFMTKSQTKRLLKNLCIQTLPGSMEMYDYGQFLNTFSVQIFKNPQVSIWVLKIDDQFQGRGLAYFQLYKCKILISLLKKIQYNTNSEFFATDINSQPANQEITLKIRDYLKQKLASKLTIVTQTLYRNYEQFMGRFIKKGGIIQAHPPCQKEFLSYPSVSFCLQPDGQFKVICTYEKISSQPFKNVACSYPQKSLENEQILSLCRQLTESFKIRKLFGYFTIDIIVYKKGQQSKYWVLDIEPYLNNYSTSYYLFDALMEGSYFPQKNIYLTEVYSQNREKQNQRYSQKELNNLVSRQYVFVPHFLNKNFTKINIKQFFKQARIEQFNFDIAQKNGICMLLFDQLTSGQMGLITVSQTKDQCIQKLKKVLQFISRITSLKNSEYGKTQLQPSTDAIYLQDIMSKFFTLQRKQQKKDARKKAIQKHKNLQNLQLIM